MKGIIEYSKKQSNTITIGLKSGITFTGRIINHSPISHNIDFITIKENFENDCEITFIPIENIEYVSYPMEVKE